MQSFQFFDFSQLRTSNLDSVYLDKLSELPSISAIYFLVANKDTQNIPVYIGQTKNLYKRWNNQEDHHVLKHTYYRQDERDYLAWLPVHDSELHLLEAALIRQFSPIYNTVKPSGKPPLESKGREIKPYKYEFFHVADRTYRVNDIDEINWFHEHPTNGLMTLITLTNGERIYLDRPKSHWKEDECIRRECLFHLAKCVGMPELFVKQFEGI